MSENLDRFLKGAVSEASGKQNVRGRLEFMLNMKSVPRNRGWFRIAGIALFAILVIYFVHFPGNNKTAGTAEWLCESARLGEKKEVKLPDGSIVWLNGGSDIIYPSSFTGDIRKVFVRGEVYADITKDSLHPFVMDAGSMSIKVFGTRFNLRSYIDSDISEVFLDEGSISAFINGYNAEIKMKPGDLVRYSQRASSLEKYTYDSGKYATWVSDNRLIIVNMRLEDIVTDLERRFDVDISIMNESLKSIRYYASFINDENLKQILSGLNNDGRMHFRGDDKTILIY